MVRLIKQSKSLKSFAKYLNISSGMQQLVQIFLSVFFLTHITSCFWFLVAKFDDFNPNTWAVRFQVVDADVSLQYAKGFYWAFQTLATVGFGDINAKTPYERVFAIFWMIFGIGFYSYTIGNMTNLIASLDTANEELQNKLSILKDFRKRTSMNNRLFLKIKRHLENN